MLKRFPIFRIGWREAHQLIQDKGYTLRVYKDGHAELLSPETSVMGRRHNFTQGHCAEYYLTRRSTELLQEDLKGGEG